MNKTKFKLEYQLGTEKKDGIPVIIVAAGASLRMKGINKQLLELKGVPIIARTLKAFDQNDLISRIILVAKEEDIFSLQLLAEKYEISKLSDIVIGGNSRQESVLKGLGAIAEAEEELLIHDGARPFISSEVIERVVSGLKSYSAVTCAVKVKDTVKEIYKDGRVRKTLKRDDLVAVQTPQGVKKSHYLTALKSLSSVALFTDDASIMEAAGFTVLTVEGDYKNIKITTPEDIGLANIYLEEEP